MNLIDPSGLVWLIKVHHNYEWVDDDKYKSEDWQGYEIVEAGTIAYFGEGWGRYQENYKELVGTHVILNVDGTLSPAGIYDVDYVNDPPSSSGYTDFNVSYGTPFFVGITAGVMLENGREYPNIGLGLNCACNQ